jgi:MraZ protein
MLLGTHTPKLDEKGRIILPAKFRDQFSSGLVITRGQDKALLVYSAADFNARAEKLSQAPITDAGARNYVRVFMSGAHAETPDKQGRVTIPAVLRQYAGLDRELVVIGAGSYAEIWDAKSWNEFLAKQENPYSDLSEEVIPGII